MKRYQVIFAIIFLAVNVLAQTQSGTQSQVSTPNTEKTLGTSEDVLPPSPNPTPPASQDTKKPLPKIEKQDIIITGEDRSKIKHEEQRLPIEKQPGSVNVPAVGVLKTETPEMLSVPNIMENQAIKPSRSSIKASQTPLYSFSVLYGSKELLSYDFSHSREVQKGAQRFSYCFGVQREKSDGFHHGTVSSPPLFGCFSTDGLNGEGVIYFKDYSVRTGMSYFSHLSTLPYGGTQTQENKLEKGGFADYDIKIPGGSALNLGINCNKCTLFHADANSVSGYLKFTTPFTANTPPIAIGSIVSHEKVVNREGTSSYDSGYYSLYAESRHIRISKVNLDVKVAVDGYIISKNRETPSQVDYLIAASYPWKPDVIFQMNVERRLSLPSASDSYVHEDYTSINFELKPQSSTKIRVSGNWYISQNVSLSTSVFSENISKYISWGTASDRLYQPANIGNVKLSGIELRLRHNLTKNLVQSISLINTNRKNQSDNNVVPYIPDARLMIGLEYADNKNLSVSLDGEYIGKRYAFILPKDKNKELQSYFLVNLTANKQVNDTLSCTFDWENLLGEECEIRDEYYGNPTIVKAGLKLKF
ncbi:MAG: TonB-dependent receptor [bacterium]